MNAIIIGIQLPLLGTMLGSAFIFFMKKEITDRMQKTLLGFASGVMVAASVWSLLIPSIDMAGERVLPAAVGFLAGIAFLPAGLRSRCHDVCGRGGTHPRNRPRSPHQPLHDWLCHRLRLDDGDGCGVGVVRK